MTDIIDHAQAIETMQRQHALSGRKREVETAEYDAAGNRTCIECGVIIPPERVNAVNAVRCVDCQTLHERQQQMRGG